MYMIFRITNCPCAPHPYITGPAPQAPDPVAGPTNSPAPVGPPIIPVQPITAVDLSHANPPEVDVWAINTPSQYYLWLVAFNIETSTNLVNWTPEYRCSNWISQASCNMLLYRNGVPIATNTVVAGQPNRVNLPVDPAPAKFFRLSP